ncbi:class I SAM-dependent methyltransferase [Ktedonosporobacter rubrisoli]|uniref:Class I SAM-dependent methyltransferase n=1 Tax=Ktedonosporobacter rubrisoli TaxID=2509675 RepID=A0A4P6JIF2_KTERU|nr:class I SAM-dependent methyltransferase [Ktedonosporobacter rubrisoli]QBD74839.1 class I SAM-dependent methyltransferase [Ktedonosporobacter rubrisoli]
MEYISGKKIFKLEATQFAGQIKGYSEVLLDLGTGDGRYVQHMAQRCPTRFVIGIDSCREHLFRTSRKAPLNALFLIANAEMLPGELTGLVDCITVNFPWGSLLQGLLTSQSRVVNSLSMIARSGATLEVRLNGSALQQVGIALAQGEALVARALVEGGFAVKATQRLDATDLRNYPTTWAKRMGYGREPNALCLRAVAQNKLWQTARDVLVPANSSYDK